MAAPINTPLTGDIWHLTVDDLFAPLPETVRLGGPGPFVINLTTAAAPLGLSIDGWRVCWVGGGDRCQVFFVVMVEAPVTPPK